jgi:hypothetical protein
MKKTKFSAKIEKGKSKATIKLLPSDKNYSCGSHGHK